MDANPKRKEEKKHPLKKIPNIKKEKIDRLRELETFQDMFTEETICEEEQ